MSDTRIRLLHEDDWPDVIAAEERAYAPSGLSEGGAALRSRHRASPSTCFVLEDADGFCGYLLALPYPLFRCPDLSRAESDGAGRGSSGIGGSSGTGGSNLHAHDLVIAERARGRGLADLLLLHLEETGRQAGYRTLSLVAVRGSQVLWSRLGYRARPEIGLPASYGTEAVYMAKPLAGPSADTAPSPSRAEVG
ncbi:GNAT family N-acetyltransferase [Kitasatospora aureofaciens]|uniref:GNAT family N-acetyltransferase n=1 Tax=Kitasatospora aureofaciens TaxID=1894 RepID=UPI0005276E8E|nr:GNAT family N-acetyltransferase [Kitasatospora aureofaciens]HJD82565.1 GNAT family N-acetyltransferase [Kitasatospora aureofaciens]